MPPKVLDTRTAYHGRIFSVAIERIRMDDGERTIDAEIVRHAPSVGIVPMPSEDTLMLVRQYRHAAGGWMWELPAGSVDEGESAEAAAARECQEELGLIAGSLERLGEFYALPGYCTELMTFFRATGLREPRAGDAEAHQDEDEDIEARAFSLDDVRRMVQSGEVRDLKTVAALALLERRPATAY